MEPGELRHRVEIQRDAGTVDGVQGRVPAWAPHREVYAKKEPITGRELFLARQARSEATVKFTIRFPKGLNPPLDETMRLVHGAKVYHIESIVDFEERGEWLILACKRGA